MQARLALLALQIPLLLTLTGCSTQKAQESASRERAEPDVQDHRPVFGYGAEESRPAAAHDNPPPAALEKREPRRQPSPEPQQRSRTAQASSPVPKPTVSSEAARAIEHPSRVGDSGVGDPGEAQATGVVSRVAPDESRRFLHYRPAGSRVLDPGEVSADFQKKDSLELEGIRTLIKQWADTLTSRRLDAHLALYATTLTSFYGDTDVSRASVREWKKPLFAEDAEIRQFEIHGVQLWRNRDGAVHARFRVRTDLPDLGGDYRMQLRSVGGVWKISAEQRVGNSQS